MATTTISGLLMDEGGRGRGREGGNKGGNEGGRGQGREGTGEGGDKRGRGQEREEEEEAWGTD